MQDAVFDESANRVVGECCCDGGAKSETAAESPGHVVLAAAFPNSELSRGVNAAFARVKTKHDFAEAEAVPAAIRIRNQYGFHIRSNETVTHLDGQGDNGYRWRRRCFVVTGMA